MNWIQNGNVTSGPVSIGEVGEVVHFDEEGGYGFVSTDHSAVDDDVFIHISNIKYDTLHEGETLYYQLHNKDRGFQAFGVIAAERDRTRKAQGKIEFYNAEKGYGFIGDTSIVAQEVFVHINDVASGELHEGDTVSFNPASGDEGPVAKQVRVTQSSHPESRDDPSISSKQDKDAAEMAGETSYPDSSGGAWASSSGTGAHSNGSGDPTNKNKLLNGDN
jgi:cold shock CspA family protein